MDTSPGRKLGIDLGGGSGAFPAGGPRAPGGTLPRTPPSVCGTGRSPQASLAQNPTRCSHRVLAQTADPTLATNMEPKRIAALNVQCRTITSEKVTREPLQVSSGMVATFQP